MENTNTFWSSMVIKFKPLSPISIERKRLATATSLSKLYIPIAIAFAQWKRP